MDQKSSDPTSPTSILCCRDPAVGLRLVSRPRSTVSSFEKLRPIRIVERPSFAKRCAMAEPMPPDAPVMIAVLRGSGLVPDGLELELVYALAKLLTTAPPLAVFVVH